MNVTIFGASGQTGMFVVERALLQEDRVTAYVRSPETFPLSADRLVIVPGDVRMPGPSGLEVLSNPRIENPGVVLKERDEQQHPHRDGCFCIRDLELGESP